MKYILIDTNMYIDMLVARNSSHKPDSYNHMIKLLDYGEIKLIVPKIIITEVRRHINNEINKVENHLKMIDKNVKDLYWINHVDEIELFKERLSPVKFGIKKLIMEFNANKTRYQNDFKNLFENLFKHKNVKVIEETPDIMFKADKRKLHKYRPFHYSKTNKDSLADAVIIETLVNIKDFIQLKDNDSIYFLSRNTEDFSSSKEDIGSLHEDIKNGLVDNNLSERVHYRLHFTKTLLEDFKYETHNAGVAEALELEYKREREEEIHSEIVDENRIAGGLPSLSADWETILNESNDIEELINTMEDYKNKIVLKYDEYATDYYTLLEEIEKENLEKSQKLLLSYKNGMPDTETIDLDDYESEEEIHEELQSLIDDHLSIDPGDFDDSIWSSKDHFEINTTLLEFETFDGDKYVLNTEGNLNPCDNGNDEVLFYLSKNKEIIEQGYISIYYGYLNFVDGQAADGSSEDISISVDKILESIEEFSNEIINEIEENIEQLEAIKDVLNIN
ncbi:DUF4935 domain-containing protein [Priestia megaterium]|uniref:PIN domain-containing protein n=1 Tax=Priestia megaterium TaxID=1404 RepID=UPI001C22E280|nr:PIN domain-containing protein [Priestia megaterium]MBU8589220.1 DUF4935 domain-containing protein [Priestia megaterium]